jgi:hypothetical protein
MNLERFRRLIEIDERCRKIKAEDKTLSEERDRLELEATEEMIEEGVSKIEVDGTLIHIRRDLYASTAGMDKDAAVAYLKRIGLGDYVSEGFNANSISAWLRERDEEGTVPNDFEDYFKRSEVFRVRTSA